MKDTLYDAILLLGLKNHSDGSMPSELLGRVRTAFLCYQKGLAPLIVACGGQTENTPVSEAEVMKNALVQMGVQEKDVLLEDKSLYTIQNIQNAYSILRDPTSSKKPHVLIVTSDYHVFRAKVMARSEGFKASGVGYQMKKDSEYFMKRKLERLFLINFLMGWETGKRKQPPFYKNFVDKTKKKANGIYNQK